MKSLILVMVGGGVGAGLRHLLNVAVLRLQDVGTGTGTNAAAWPWSTFAANVLGGLLMGALMGWLTHGLAHGPRGVDHELRLLLGVGLLGGFTTFSAFSMEMVMMIQRGDVWQSAVYGVLSVILALAAVFAGLSISKGIFA